MNEIDATFASPHPLLTLGRRLSRVPRRQAAVAGVLAMLATGGMGALLTVAHPNVSQAAAGARPAMFSPHLRFGHGHRPGWHHGHVPPWWSERPPRPPQPPLRPQTPQSPQAPQLPQAPQPPQ
jgi:hypothetical protein